MRFRVKRYDVLVLPKKLKVSSLWHKDKFEMEFPIQRWNPLSYFLPVLKLLYRKYLRRYYFYTHKNQKWHICDICHKNVGKDFIAETFPVCEECKKTHE